MSHEHYSITCLLIGLLYKQNGDNDDIHWHLRISCMLKDGGRLSHLQDNFLLSVTWTLRTPSASDYRFPGLSESIVLIIWSFDHSRVSLSRITVWMSRKFATIVMHQRRPYKCCKNFRAYPLVRPTVVVTLQTYSPVSNYLMSVYTCGRQTAEESASCVSITVVESRQPVAIVS